MDGYKIVYKDEKGLQAITWFGSPISSFDVPATDAQGIVSMMFGMAHPGCEVVSIVACTLEEYQAEVS